MVHHINQFMESFMAIHEELICSEKINILKIKVMHCRACPEKCLQYIKIEKVYDRSHLLSTLCLHLKIKFDARTINRVVDLILAVIKLPNSF